MPTAAPVTAATTGFSMPTSACMKRNTGESAPRGGRCMKSSRSLPDVKMPGWPVISTARTALSAPAASSASAIAWYIAAVIAFFFSGRAISIVATPFRVAVLMFMRVSRCFGRYADKNPCTRGHSVVCELRAEEAEVADAAPADVRRAMRCIFRGAPV